MSYTLQDALRDCETMTDPFDLNGNGIADPIELVNQLVAEAQGVVSNGASTVTSEVAA